MMRPRVVMVTGNAPPVVDGVGDFTARLMDHLVRQRPDWRWDWLCRRPRWFHSPLVHRQGVRLIRPTHSWGPRGRSLACATVRMLRPDLVHVQEQIHSFHETDAACRIAGAAGCPVVATLHEYHVELPSVRFTDDLVRKSAVVVANDPRNAERCVARTGREVDHLWWSGATILPLESGDRPATVPGRLTTFGFLNGLKRLDVVAAALRFLRVRLPDLHWKIVGPFEPRSNPAHADLASRVGGDGVEFTGALPADRLGRMLAETEIMVLPYADGASERRTTLHAAWAFGLPVVTTPPPTARTSIADGENCLLVREPTAEAWAAAIERILTDAPLADRLRAGSLAAARALSWDRLASLHLEMYDRLLGATIED